MATIGATTSNVTAAVTNNATTNEVVKDTLASNFTTFLQLLTTQLKNQNPLDPLDTNQFTQQLVQFAQVEQQLKSNDQLSTLVALQKSVQSTQALGYVGQTVAIDGQTSKLANGKAGWSFNSPKPATGTINILNSAGATVFTGTYSLNSGIQNFVWDGRDNSGVKQADGNYKIVDHRQGCERPDGRGLDRNSGRRQFRRHDQEPAGAERQQHQLRARQDQARGAQRIAPERPHAVTTTPRGTP